MATFYRGVYRACVSFSCDPSSRDGYLIPPELGMDPTAGQGFAGIGVIRSENVYLVSDKITQKVFLCELQPASFDKTVDESCSVFVSSMSMPSAIIVDPDRELIYIADSERDVVGVFTYKGGQPISHLGKKDGDLKNIVAMRFRPGVYAPFCTFTPPDASAKIVAGDSITIPFFLKNVHKSNITSSSQLDGSRFAITATGQARLDDGTTTVAVTIYGSVPHHVDGSALSSFSSDIVLHTAGNWTYSIMEVGSAIPTHFGGSPFLREVFADATKPSACKSHHNESIVAGEHWTLRVNTFDKFSNPTNDKSDRFEGWFHGRENAVFSLNRVEMNHSKSEPASFVFSRAIRTIGTNIVYIKHTNSGNEVTGSPFTFQVFAVPSSNSVDQSSWYGIFGAGGLALFFGA